MRFLQTSCKILAISLFKGGMVLISTSSETLQAGAIVGEEDWYTRTLEDLV